MLWYFLEWSIPDHNGRNRKLTSLDYKKSGFKTIPAHQYTVEPL